ncbi:MAG: hypothetical protein ABFD16_16255 [Thermoguttaceae bacterium]
MAKERISPDHTVRDGIRELRRKYALGQKLDQESPKRARYGDGVLRERAEQLGMDLSQLIYLRLFARRYSPGDLRELLALRTAEGLPLRWNHVRLLIAIKDRRTRNRLQRQAARDGWTVEQLRLESRLRFGKTHEAGPKLRRPHSPDAALLRLSERSDLLRDFYGMFLDPEEMLLAELGKKPRAEGLRKRRELLNRAIQSMAELGAKASVLAGRLKDVEKRLAPRK